MDKHRKTECTLCGFPVKIAGFTLKNQNGHHLYFCCEGCVQVYRLFHSQELIEMPKPHQKT
jgi:hypothetical protein